MSTPKNGFGSVELAGTSALEYIKYTTLTRICCRSLRRREKDIFEELEKEEDNVDKMIDDYVTQQIEEDKRPKEERPKPKPRDPNAPPRKRRKRTPSPEEDTEEEECTQRGRDYNVQTIFGRVFHRQTPIPSPLTITCFVKKRF